MRDVKLQERIFVMLTAQYEDARISEARDVATVQLLDAAKKPEYKIRPKRITMMASVMGISLVRAAFRRSGAIIITSMSVAGPLREAI